jgi:hypothetical protein
MNIHLTEHARKRTAQRCIPEVLIDLILKYGSDFESRTGTQIRALNDRMSKKEVSKELFSMGIKPRDPWWDTYLVVTHYGVVITVGHRFRRIKKKFH